ncbi:hypothetical protein DID81_00980 [Lacticaseibacillus rhamnosus]|uniref:Alpha-galactosidase n=1 Tax=Lacticaseibacillus rhamnosus TaxID=47715 RepID=A0AB74I8M7_LACRH|nr:hypothetical protein [Lacticaseibacillus rhamnosus]GEM61439.1 hypothetical protein LR1_21210 [Lacticaseibacillus rhamnosus DSM 20021 = JCM 1136 = NBRC 3425]MCT3158957.1 hypothetical protein [Lacticaseibacillus rhamnosus]MCT3187732.1 hypothetical protein [Lacticaseibacillus rhamnosus]PIN35006.1 hypothetical protein CUC11_01465 [Lacticaseibacillus rhamnosus]
MIADNALSVTELPIATVDGSETRSPAQKSTCKDLSRNGQNPADLITAPKRAHQRRNLRIRTSGPNGQSPADQLRL